VTATPAPVGLDRAKFDLTLSMMPGADGVAGALEYDADLFDVDRVTQWRGLFVDLLAQVADGTSDTPLSTLSLVTADEAAQLRGFQGDVCEIPEETVAGLLTAQALRTPDAEAVVFEGDTLSYGALAARANQLARHLVSEGAGPDDIVAIALDRSLEMVVSIVAVLQSGAAYLPLDPALPAARLDYMLDDSQARLTITTTGTIGQHVRDHGDDRPCHLPAVNGRSCAKCFLQSHRPADTGFARPHSGWLSAPGTCWCLG
jgi:non-ribosomal peptide synthetase component F